MLKKDKYRFGGIFDVFYQVRGQKRTQRTFEDNSILRRVK